MYDLAYVGKENENEFLEKVYLDNDSENSSFTDETSIEVKSSPSFYTVSTRKKIGYRRTKAKERYRGQRDGEHSFSHENRAYNNLCKKAVFESTSSIIKRGYDDYLDEIEEKIRAKEIKESLLEERNKDLLQSQFIQIKLVK